MFQNQTITQFFNIHAKASDCNRALIRDQIYLMNALCVTASQGLAGTADCVTDIVGTHTVSDTILPVVRFSFPNGASVTICDRGAGHNCIVAVRSNIDLAPAKPTQNQTPDATRHTLARLAVMIEKMAYSTTQAIHPDCMPGMPDGRHAPYAHNRASFTFMTDDQAMLGEFMARFAMLHRPQHPIAPDSAPDFVLAPAAGPQVSAP